MSELHERLSPAPTNVYAPSPDLLALRSYPTDNIPLGESVSRALTHHFGINPDDIFIQENVEKYYNADHPLTADQELKEVFQLMRGLNETALSNQSLCRVNGEGASFVDALSSAVDAIIKQFQGQTIHYVELGPEPIKTSYILNKLLANGVNIESYVGVDINPASSSVMKQELSQLLPLQKIQNKVQAFSQFQADSIRKANTPCLITMLGFQEGNESPQTMLSWLSQIASPNDIMLSEMQLMPVYGSEPIVSFYQNPLMKRFSNIAFQRMLGNQASVGRTFILPLTMADGEKIEAAIMCHEYFDNQENLKLFVSNYCLKYSRAQLRHYREVDEYFEVINESLTDDASVLFQIAQRQ